MGGGDVRRARDAAADGGAGALYPGDPCRARRAGAGADGQWEDGGVRAADPAPPGGGAVRRVRAGGDADARAGVPAGRAVPRAGLAGAAAVRGGGRRHGHAHAGAGAGGEASHRDCHPREDQGSG